MGNNITREVARKSVFPDASDLTSAAVTYDQGDILCLKGGLVQRSTADADTANSLGVAVAKVVAGKLAGPYDGLTAVDAAQAAGKIPGPAYGVVASLTLKTSDAFNPGDLVYHDVSDPQTVTITQGAGAEAIGVYVGSAVASAAAGQKSEVHIGSQFPGGVLAL